MADFNVLDQVTAEFLSALRHDAGLIQHAGERLFYLLAVIQIALSALWMTLSGESIQSFLAKMVQLAFNLGFFYALILNGGVWIPALLNGFIQIGQSGGVTSLDPSSILDQGLVISGGILKGFYSWGLLAHPLVSLVGATACIAIIILYAFMSAELVMMLVKSYIIIAVGGLFFAFGASDYTRQMTARYFQASIGLGLQLMSLYLLLGIGRHLGPDWAKMTASAAKNHELMPMLAILAAIIVYYLVLKNIPAFIAGLSGVSGFRNYGDAAVGLAINSGLSGARMITNIAGGSGRVAQGLTQAGGVALKAGHGAASAAFQQSSLSSALYKGTGALSKGLVGSTFNATKDAATRTNSHLTFGQKLNSHLANHVDSVRKGK